MNNAVSNITFIIDCSCLEGCNQSNIDFGILTNKLSYDKWIQDVIFIGLRPEQWDNIWNNAKDYCFDINFYELKTELVARVTETICTSSQPQEIMLLTTDCDLLPLIRVAQRHDWTITIWAFKEAINNNSEILPLINSSMNFLDDICQ